MDTDKFKKHYNKMLEDNEILQLEDIRAYIGVFTGKMIKRYPKENKNYSSFDDFKKGDKVIVLNLNDYIKWHKGKDMILEQIDSILKKH